MRLAVEHRVRSHLFSATEEALSRYDDSQRLQGLSLSARKRVRYALLPFGKFLVARSISTVEAITPELVFDFVQSEKRNPSKYTARPVSKGTLKARITELRKFLRFLASEGAIPDDCGASTSYYGLDLTDDGYMTAREVAAILEKIDVAMPIGIRDRAMFELIYGCALRWVEAEALRLCDVDLEALTIRVAEGDAVGRAKRSCDTLRTWPRMLPIPSAAVEWMGHYLHDIRPRIIEWKPTDCDRLFIDFTFGRAIGRGGAEPRFRLARLRAGTAKKSGPHLVRDCMALHLLEAGAVPAAVWWFMGFTPLEDEAVIARYRAAILAAHPRNSLGCAR